LGAAAALDGVLAAIDLRNQRVAVGLSGGVDSVVLLHLLKERSATRGFSLRAVHVHHGLSPNAGKWERRCRALCRQWQVSLKVHRVKVRRNGHGLEAAARAARYAVFREEECDVLMLAHQLDDQAETVLLNLLRGAGPRGASGMAVRGSLGKKILFRPLLGVPREAIVAYARAQRLRWVEDESNRDEALARGFIRRRIAPLLTERFPRWRESLARAARHFARHELEAGGLLREFLSARGLRAPSEGKLVEMLRQLAGKGARTEMDHDGAKLRVYRGQVFVSAAPPPAMRFAPLAWSGERRVRVASLGGELHFARARGRGFVLPEEQRLEVRLRAGGERLQPDARRPRRTLKNLFQEAGVPPWERERLPLLFCDRDLVWAPGLGVDARYQAARGQMGWLPRWRRLAAP
jgi:tRNA(Ile)-lysidine synthase